jgi:hypothetical protein
LNKQEMEPRLARRQLKCLHCDNDLRNRRGVGRKATYCGDRCRRDAEKGRAWARKNEPARVVAQRGRNASKASIKTNTNDARFVDRTSRFSVPLDILGGGSFRWLGTPSLDRSTRDRIVDLETRACGFPRGARAVGRDEQEGEP